MGQTDYGVVESQGGYRLQWQTLNFTQTPPVLEEGVDYALVVWGINDPYGIYIAAGYSVNPDSIYLQYSDEYFNYPSTLDTPYSDYYQYSIYATITPIT